MAPVKFLIVCVVMAFVWILVPSLPGHTDMNCWKDWAIYIHEHGLHNVYYSWTDYPPVLHYLLWLIGKLSGSTDAIVENIRYIKSITLMFDLVGLWFLYKWLDRKVDFLVIIVLCLFNISYTYDSMIWGQLDGVLATLVFISLYYGYHNKPVLSGLFFLLVVNFKLQAIVFLPVWGLLYLNTLITVPKPRNFILPVVSMAVLEGLILFPFIRAGALKEIYRVVFGSVDKYPYVGLYTKNFWNFIFGKDTEWVPDSWFWFGGITYKQAGLFMFFTASFFVLIPMLIRTVKRIKEPANKCLKISQEQLWLTSALLVMSFYFFNTQMHDRYGYPAFIFIAAYSFNSRNMFPFALFSVAMFLNLENALQIFHFKNYGTLIFQDTFIAALYAVVMIYLSIKLARSYSGTKIDKKEVPGISF